MSAFARTEQSIPERRHYGDGQLRRDASIMDGNGKSTFTPGMALADDVDKGD